MYGQNRNSGIRILPSYADALRWHTDTPPIRGNGANAGVKPLGHRDRPHFQIIRKEDNSIVCKCYQTDVVTFMPDGLVKIDNGEYNTQTTAHFIYDVLGISSGIKDNELQVYVDGGYYRVKSGMTIKRDDRGIYKVIDYVSHEVYRLDRKRMTELRKKVKPYRTFLTGMMKVHDRFYERDELETALYAGGVVLGSNWTLELTHWREDTAQILPRLNAFMGTITQEDSEGNWYRASLMLIWSGRGFYTQITEYGTNVNRKLDELLIATHPEVLLVSQCERGVSGKNRYAKFKPYKELQG